jgi:acetyl esterase
MAFPKPQEKLKQNSFTKSLEQHRKRLMSLVPTVKPASMSYKESIIHHQGIPLSIWTYRPNDGRKVFPTIFYVPGTAFIAQSPAYTHSICSHLAEQSRCQVIAIHNRLAPEHPFPEGIYDAYAVLKTLLETPPSWTKIDLKKVALLGDSSGGNFVISMGLFARIDQLPLSRIILISPILDISLSDKGYGEFERQDKLITNSFLDWFLDLYVPKNVERNDVLLSPFWQNETNLQVLPPIDIIVGENDRFRGDAEGFYLKLLNANITTNKLIIPTTDHTFWWRQIAVVQSVARRAGIALNSTPYTQLIGQRIEKSIILQKNYL